MRVVAITGSRVFPWRRANEIADVLRGAELLIVGCASGADAIARKLAARSYIPILECRANWPALGNPAGPARNEVMATFAKIFHGAGHQVTCYAFPIGESWGTRGCISLMKVAGVPVVVQEGE